MNKALWTRSRLFVVAALILVVSGLFVWSCSDQRNATNPQPVAAGLIANNDISAAIAVQNRHSDELMAKTSVVGTGITKTPDGRFAIMVFTLDQTFSGVPSSIEGMPTVIEHSGPFEAFALSKRYRPVPIGVSCGNNNECAAGTIGCQVWRNGQLYLLSNNHVLARENNASIGEPIVQPGRYDRRCRNYLSTDYVADLADFEPIKFDGRDNTIDCAIASYVVSDVSCATLSNYYGFPNATTVAAYVNQPIKKVGRTSSLTTGTVIAVNVTSNVGYSSGTARFVGQIYTSGGFSRSGDSGSLVVTNDSNNNPVGLLFAGTSRGNSLLNPIDLVLTRFNATICAQ